MTCRVIAGNPAPRADLDGFLARLDRLADDPEPAARTLFDRSGELVCARAPGRLDVMGGIADYSGSLVLELPLREAAWVAVLRTAERDVRIVSPTTGPSARAPDFHVGIADLEPQGRPLEYAAARGLFAADPERRWAAYVAGALLVLRAEGLLRLTGGLRILLDSAVPEAKGVSSSAAIEVAAMWAICEAYGLSREPRDLAILCQKVENLVAGAPCGVMDQMTAALGEEGQLLALLCQPAEPRGHVAVPDEVAFFGLDSGIRHAVSGSDYGAVRVGAFMGYRILADAFGFPVRVGAPGEPLSIEDPRFGGFLANIDPAEFEVRHAGLLPETLAGSEFLDRFGGTTDVVTRVDPARTYPVRQATVHPVFEHARVAEFGARLGRPVTTENLLALGELMYASHRSYSACGLGSAGTDLLVELVRQAGPARGLYGAKITGGGSGGTVAILARRDARGAVGEVAAEYQRCTGTRPYLFHGSSPGAAAYGVFRVRREPGCQAARRSG